MYSLTYLSHFITTRSSSKPGDDGKVAVPSGKPSRSRVVEQTSTATGAIPTVEEGAAEEVESIPQSDGTVESQAVPATVPQVVSGLSSGSEEGAVSSDQDKINKVVSGGQDAKGQQ